MKLYISHHYSQGSNEPTVHVSNYKLDDGDFILIEEREIEVPYKDTRQEMVRRLTARRAAMTRTIEDWIGNLLALPAPKD